jgi:hypothetical protein
MRVTDVPLEKKIVPQRTRDYPDEESLAAARSS